MTTRIALVAPLFCLLASCSSATPAQPPLETSNGTTAPEDAGFIVQSDGGLFCPPSAATSCSTLGVCGSPVIVSQAAQYPPAALGGTITPGRYVMSSYVNYTGPGGATGATVIWFKEIFTLTSASVGGEMADADTGLGSGTLLYEDAQDSSEVSSPVWSTGTWLASGASLDIDYVCSGAGTGDADFSYTATATTITLIFPQEQVDGTGVIAYTLID